jgi:quercetin dioxygenase-like cupin family protein
MEDKLNKPEITLLKKGAAFKILQVQGIKGTQMPQHLSTKEAIIIVEEGSALIKINNEEHLLKKSDSFIIPAGVPHSLLAMTNLRAQVIMPIESEIKFIN